MPLVPNSFPNGTHLCTFSACHCLRCSSPTAFARHLVGQAHMEAPSGNTVNDIHDYSEAKQLGVKVEFIEDQSAKCPFRAIGVVYESY